MKVEFESDRKMILGNTHAYLGSYYGFVAKDVENQSSLFIKASADETGRLHFVHLPSQQIYSIDDPSKPLCHLLHQWGFSNTVVIKLLINEDDLVITAKI